jgi:hypothetical protein
MPETRVDRHHQYLVYVLQDFFQHCRRRRRVDDHAGAFTQRLDALHGAMQISVAFPVHEKRIGPCFDKLLEEKVRVGNHQVGFQGQACHWPEGVDDHRPH